MESEHSLSRRTVLKATGGAFAATASGVGAAAGTPGGRASEADSRRSDLPDGHVEVNVGVDAPAGRDAARAAASDVVREIETLGVVTIRAPERAATALRNRPDVRFVEENGTVHALAQTTPWGVDRIDADQAHEVGITGDGADVTVVDTGIDDDHPDLQANLGDGRAFVTCGTGGFDDCSFSGNSNACNEPWSDDNDHGTHVAGTIAAVNDTGGVVGVGPDLTLHAAKALDCSGAGSFSDIAAAIDWAARQGHDVVNLSLGASSGSAAVDRAINFAASQGVTMVAAAGGSGPCSACVAYPANHPEVMAVGATDCDDTLASFSSTGPSLDLVAPGVEVVSTVPAGTATLSGTSMACAHVSGAAGVLAARGLTRASIEPQLESTAKNPGGLPAAGLLDVAAAVGEPSTDDTFADAPHC